MAKTQTIKISKIKANPNNPRLIKDDKFKKLVTSIQESPTFMILNPIKVDEDMMVLGGNMRMKACISLGWKDIPYTIFTREMADENNKGRDKPATYEEQCKEFIIKDNMGYGEDDWELITQQYDTEDLDYWGKDILNWAIEPNEDELTNEDERNNAEIKITFVSVEQMKLAKLDLEQLMEAYKGAYFSIRAGEL